MRAFNAFREEKGFPVYPPETMTEVRTVARIKVLRHAGRETVKCVRPPIAVRTGKDRASVVR